MGNFTFEEMNLMCIYNTGSRTGLIDSLREMRGELAPEETELRELTDSALGKLQAMSDAEFAELELYPDFCNITLRDTFVHRRAKHSSSSDFLPGLSTFAHNGSSRAADFSRSASL